MIISFERLWEKLARSKKYREHFATAFAKRSIPSQIRELMRQQELSQEKLAKQSGLTQGVISRAIDLNYGNLTLNTIVRIAAGLDCAFVGKYVPFSELGRHVANMPESVPAHVPTFEQENASRRTDSNFNPSEDGNIAASQGGPDVNSVRTERKPMGTADDEAKMATAAGTGGR
jgi:transcriptional regulator with XRE-family HTH domain